MNKLWGQLLMVGIPGQELDEITRAIIQDLQVGGIILFKRNIAHPQQVADLIQACQKTALDCQRLSSFCGGRSRRWSGTTVSSTFSRNACRRASSGSPVTWRPWPRRLGKWLQSCAR